MGDCITMIAERPDGKGGVRKVEVDDVGRAFLRFASGAQGSIEGNWIATGRKMQHDFEVYGEKVRSPSRRNASTNCISIRRKMLPVAGAFDGSKRRRIMRLTGVSASRPATS